MKRFRLAERIHHDAFKWRGPHSCRTERPRSRRGLLIGVGVGLGLGLGCWLAVIRWLGWGAAGLPLLALAALLLIAWREGRG